MYANNDFKTKCVGYWSDNNTDWVILPQSMVRICWVDVHWAYK